MQTYQDMVESFRWEDVLEELGWAGRRHVNLAQTIVDRHAAGPLANETALVWLGRGGENRSLSFRDLSEESSRFANLLTRLGVKKGDRVAVFMPRIPETFVAMLGAFKAGAVYVPIFTGFGPDGVRYRLAHSGTKVLCTHHEHRAQVPDGVAGRIVCVAPPGATLETGDIDFHAAISSESADFDAVPCRRDDPAAIIYTSGSTGQPKGGVIAANLLCAIWPYIRFGVDLRPRTDLFWPTGDPGWGYGLCCYLAGLAMGGRVLAVQANPTAQDCLDILEGFGVTNLATTPTLLRSLMALGEDKVHGAKGKPRAISSCGEPLNGEVVEFFRRVWQVTPMDHYGATEFALPVGNYNAAAMDVKPGSMGLLSPGYQMAVVDEEGHELPFGETGLIAQKTDKNSLYWMRYWDDDAATAELRRNGWSCVGDLARRDKDGYFWFEGRADDMIKSAGYRIGPFEVESAILEHPAVAEAAVVGKPDALKGHIVKAFVVLNSGMEGSTELAEEIANLVKTNLGNHQYPRDVQFVPDLPKTQTGKIQRFLLRERA